MTVVSLDTHRAAKIGGSEAADACGVGFRSRLRLWWDKSNGIEPEETEAMRLSTLLQPAVAEIVGERGYEIMPAPADGFIHPELAWMIVHPDGFTSVDGARAVAEIKTRGTAWSHDDEERALFSYIMQVQHGMAVTGLDAGLLAVLHGGHGGMRLELREVERDDELISRMIELEGEIVEAIRLGVPPFARGEKSDADAIRLMHPGSDGSTKRATKAVERWASEARALKEQRDECDRQYKERVQNIEVFMGEAESLLSLHDRPLARWPTVNSTRLDTSALKAARPDVYSEFAVSKGTRRFTLE